MMLDQARELREGPSLMNQRRLRQSRWTRELSRNNWVQLSQLIQPYFVVQGAKQPQEIPGLTGVFRETESSLLQRVEADLENGIHKALLFLVPDSGEKSGNPAVSSFGLKQIQALKKRFGKDLFLSVDVCLCSSTDHGHCGILSAEGDHVENDQTVSVLADWAVQYAQAGADCVAPSDMMDGRIGAIRQGLDQKGLDRTLILSYAAKFHSKFYGPFRLAADSAPKGSALKNRATYQIDPTALVDAVESSKRDAQEGADFLMLKPGMPYLDVLTKLVAEIPKPWFVYEVSGEFASREVLGQQGLMDAPMAHVESWLGMIRAGATGIVTYGARQGRAWLQRAESEF